MSHTPESGLRWPLRRVPDELRRRYLEHGWWSDTSIGTLVAEGLATKGSTAFNVWSRTRPWQGTLGDVDRAARAFATALRAKGVGAGDVVVFQLPNCVEAAIAFWGAQYVGAVVVPIVHFYGPKEVSYILRTVDPAVIVTADRFGRTDYLGWYEDLVAGLGTDAQWLVVRSDDDSLPGTARAFTGALDEEPLDEVAPVDPDQPAVVAFTSGTTRDPKGVVHSHRTIGFEARQLGEWLPKVGSPPLVGAPVGHFMGMLLPFLVSMHRPDPVNLIDVWDPGDVLRTMREQHLGVSGGSTYFLTSLLDHPDFTEEHLALMPWCGLGGSPIPVAVAERATALGITLKRSYGSTEHPSITGSYLDDPEDKRLRTDGRPLPSVEVRLGDEGEILTRGADCCVGYTDARLTATAFDDDGWYHTGDVGVLDDEGYLTITDRISDVIIRGGENISAQEVEELLLGLATVAEVYVVAEPDERLGERAAAVVRARDGAAAPSLQEVRDHLAGAGLARQKWPESIHEVTDFPRTASGKVQKFVLRDQLRAGALEQSP